MVSSANDTSSLAISSFVLFRYSFSSTISSVADSTAIFRSTARRFAIILREDCTLANWLLYRVSIRDDMVSMLDSAMATVMIYKRMISMNAKIIFFPVL